jgi:hypothetical protein
MSHGEDALRRADAADFTIAGEGTGNSEFGREGGASLKLELLADPMDLCSSNALFGTIRLHTV